MNQYRGSPTPPITQGPSMHFLTNMWPNVSGKMHNNSFLLVNQMNGPRSFQQKMVSIHFPASAEPNFWQTISKNYPRLWGLHTWSTNFPAYDSFSLACSPFSSSLLPMFQVLAHDLQTTSKTQLQTLNLK